MQAVEDRLKEPDQDSALSAGEKALIEEIQSRFQQQQQINKATQYWMILDPALRDATALPEFTAGLSALKSPISVADLPRVSWLHRNLKPEHRPYLVPLDLADPAAQQLLSLSLQLALEDHPVESLAQGAGQRVCGWFFTDQHVSSIAQHMGQLAVQRLPRDLPRHAGKSMLLRYYDPSVMPNLWALSDSVQRKALLGPIAQWLMLNRAKQLQAYTPVTETTAETDAPSPLRYSSQQWLAIQSIGGLNQAAFQWQMQHPNGQPPSNQQIQDTLRALVRAQGYGIEDERDLKAFAWHALTIHPLFDQHAIIKQALSNLAAEKYYTAAISELTEPSWQRIQHELSSGAPRQAFDFNPTSANP